MDLAKAIVLSNQTIKEYCTLIPLYNSMNIYCSENHPEYFNIKDTCFNHSSHPLRQLYSSDSSSELTLLELLCYPRSLYRILHNWWILMSQVSTWLYWSPQHWHILTYFDTKLSMFSLAPSAMDEWAKGPHKGHLALQRS